MEYGFHRVIEPKGVVPQSAYKLDNTPRLRTEYEMLVTVDALNLDSTSMRQLREQGNIEQRILEIVTERGKMHNPITNSGGVLLGNVKEVGKAREKVAIGEKIISLSSLSTIPLNLRQINEIKGDFVYVQGDAILFQSIPYAKVPEEYEQKPHVALSALDISSIVPQVYRTIKEGDTVLVIGTGKAGITASAAIRKNIKKTEIITTDISAKSLHTAIKLVYADKYLQLNAQNQEDFFYAIEDATSGGLCDVVINCVNAPNTEASSILACKRRGTVIFFSMTTQFDKTVLATDATGKDVNILLGNGIAERQAEDMFELLKEDEKLRMYFENHPTNYADHF